MVVLQPAYLPWLGFFDQMLRSDVFVYYDDVQYDKHGWRNRNRIKSATGEPCWLTVPVLRSGRGWPRVMEVEIDRTAAWAKKHIGTIRQYYARAPFARRYLPELEEMLHRDWRLLVDLDLAVVELMCRWLAISRPIHRSSELGIGGERSDRLLELCRHFDANRYLSGNAAQAYLDLDLFSGNGIAVEWQDYAHPTYPQLHGPFVPYLSALDLLFNCGHEAEGILKAKPTAASKEAS
jgi:hypothetical protein